MLLRSFAEVLRRIAEAAICPSESTHNYYGVLQRFDETPSPRGNCTGIYQNPGS